MKQASHAPPHSHTLTALPGCLQCMSRVTAPATVLGPKLVIAMQKTLDELIDRGDISTRDLDTRTMDALEGR